MQKLLNYLKLPLIALIVIAFIYSGLNLADLKNKNQTLEKTQAKLTEKVDGLKENLAKNQTEVNEAKQKLDDYQKELERLSKIASAPKTVLGAQTGQTTTTASSQNQPAPQPTETKIVQPQIITKTVTQKVYVKQEPKKQANVTIQNIGSFQVDWQANDTAWSILKRASQKNGFPLEYQDYSFGVFVTAIGGIKPVGNQYWAFYYNGQYSMVGASGQTINSGDTTFWRIESF